MTRDKLVSSVDTVPLLGVVDAKDCYDKFSSDTSSWGSQKSLAYTVANIEQIFRRPNTSIRWTATQNMFVDAGTKDMDSSHLRQILQGGFWSVEYCADFVKTNKSKPLSSRQVIVASVPGMVLDPQCELVTWLGSVAGKAGWHKEDSCVFQVSKNAKSFRTPEPRFAQSQYPFRSSFGLFLTEKGTEWSELEKNMSYSELPNPKAQFPEMSQILVSVFRSKADFPY